MIQRSTGQLKSTQKETLEQEEAQKLLKEAAL